MNRTVADDHRARSAGHAGDLKALCEAFLLVDTGDECRKFLLDLCTPAEISALAERWKVARLLNEGLLSYREIHDRTGVSLATITRVARFLRQEPHHGYRAVLEKLQAEKRRGRAKRKT